MKVFSDVGEWKRAGPSEGGGRGAHSNILSVPGQLNLGRTFPASESEDGSYYWLQMTFASIYLLHFDFAFNFRSIHSVCATQGMRNGGSQERSLDTPGSRSSWEGGTLN